MGVREDSPPTAVAVGHIMPPAVRADFMNELLLHDATLKRQFERGNDFFNISAPTVY